MPQGKIRRYLRHGMLPQLRVFEAVARHGSFTRAAEELHMAQPTVSVQIKKLTETVGMPLLEQVGKRVHLTAAGQELYAGCREIFDALSGIEDALSDIRGLKSGSLRLAASTTAKYLAPHLLAAFVKVHPGIEVFLHIGCRQAILERLSENTDDLYIVANPPDDEDIVVQRILPNPVVALARTDHPLAGKRAIAFDEFAQEPFLTREQGSGTRMIGERIFAAHGIEPKVRMELGSNEAIKEAIVAGLGVAILYRHAIGFAIDPAQLAVLDVAGFPMEAHWHFAYPVGEQLSPVAQAFLDFVRKHAQRVMSGQLNGTRQYGLSVET
jgi:LysR family transcriptional regulator, low CO2-responsive transcriptional regulator